MPVVIVDNGEEYSSHQITFYDVPGVAWEAMGGGDAAARAVAYTSCCVYSIIENRTFPIAVVRDLEWRSPKHRVAWPYHTDDFSDLGERLSEMDNREFPFDDDDCMPSDDIVQALHAAHKALEKINGKD